MILITDAVIVIGDLQQPVGIASCLELVDEPFGMQASDLMHDRFSVQEQSQPGGEWMR
jgi:hypothetical protein